MSRLLMQGLLLSLTLTLGGCELVGDVLAFGFWAGLITVLLLVAVAVWIFKKLF